MYRPFLFLLFSLSASAFLWGQQQTPLTLAEAEAQFQSKNLMLIAERFNVDQTGPFFTISGLSNVYG